MPQNEVLQRQFAIPAFRREMPPQHWTKPLRQAFFDGVQVGLGLRTAGYGVSTASANKAKFDILAAEWQKATRRDSSIHAKSMHPAYQKIIGMGKDALPFIFEHFKKEPGHWFWALNSITGELPVPKEDLGKLDKMRSHWLAWGIRNGYIDVPRR